MNLNMIKPYFPHAFASTSVKPFVIALLIYAVVASLGGFILSLFSVIPILRFIFSVLKWILRIYCAAGVVLSLLVFLKIVE